MSYPLLAQGKYTAHVKSTAFRITPNSKEEIALWFEVAGEDEGDTPHNVPAYLYFSEGAQERSLESLRAAGWTGDNIGELLDLVDASQLLPDAVEIVVEHNEYQGNTRARVKWINKLGGGPRAQPAAPTAKAAFAARMKGLVASKPAAPGAAPREKVAPLKSQGGQHKTTRMAAEPDSYGEYPEDNPPF